jgi:phosphatidylinositol-3-phosphatase
MPSPTLLQRLLFSAAVALPLVPRADAEAVDLVLQKPKVTSVFVIDLENHNWTQTNDPTAPGQIFGNPAAPFINSLVQSGGAAARLVSYATQYHNVLSVADGSGPSIHPSEPNYIWQECGSNLGVASDDDPYGHGTQAAAIATYLSDHPSASGGNLCALLQEAGITWHSYQEDIDLETVTNSNGNLGGKVTSAVAPRAQWTVPLGSISGTSDTYRNPYNGSQLYAFACKHNGPLFFPATNGSTPTVGNLAPSNPETPHYLPLQQLATDLQDNTVARYNLITPDLYNDMHTALPTGFTYHGVHYAGDDAEVAQGDNFLSIVVPLIEASAVFRRGGVIIIWTDETEGTDPNNFEHCLTEIVISPLAKGNATQVSSDLTHSSDLATMQKIFGVRASTPTGYLNDAANPSNGTKTRDLAGFFRSGVIPAALPPAGSP